LSHGSELRSRIAQDFGRFGISRVADITGLDRLGVPVFACIRPNSRALCISNGKGLATGDAWLSAVMEAAEVACAEETTENIAFVATTAELAMARVRTIQLGLQARAATQHITAQTRLAWSEGYDLRTGQRLYAPYELVGLDFSVDGPWNHEAFFMSSVGLAAHVSRDKAIRHALCELVEEDAAYGFIHGGVPKNPKSTSQVVFNLSLSGRKLKKLVTQLEAKDVTALFRVLRADEKLTVVAASLRTTADDIARKPAFVGFACRGSCEQAALAALLEALQVRLTTISGARDDLYADSYAPSVQSSLQSFFAPAQFKTAEANLHQPLHISDLLAFLAREGADDISVFPLNDADANIHVVRVLVDKLLCKTRPGFKTEGARAARQLLAHWGSL
jgi:ribosomal protein S12 methylthiotransferase accessory factor